MINSTVFKEDRTRVAFYNLTNISHPTPQRVLQVSYQVSPHLFQESYIYPKVLVHMFHKLSIKVIVSRETLSGPSN